MHKNGEKKVMMKEEGLKWKYDIIVFSHLRWNFVYQRPQQLLSRFAKDNRILFVEEPVGETACNDNAELQIIHENLHILQPRVNTIPAIKSRLKMYLPAATEAIAWFYSPAFISVMDDFHFNQVVYDCMDELTLFKGAAGDLAVQENNLLEKAEVVFTGGKLLYESKSKRHNKVLCFPSSVEQSHFKKALNGIAVPADIRALKPVVGYYGVIDERIDLDLLAATAALLPRVDFVMIGPLAKICPEELPRLGNIHYLGMKAYELLPNYLKAFDIAMMPFAINDATKFISPTKTLEYMAANKPIISTPVYDVVRDYSHCVSIVNDAATFAAAIENILNCSDADKKARTAQFQSILQATSWDNTVEMMKEFLKKAKSNNGEV